MSTSSYTDAELAALEAVGRRRAVVALTDVRQLHFGDFSDVAVPAISVGRCELLTDGGGDAPDPEILADAGYSVADLPAPWERLDGGEGQK